MIKSHKSCEYPISKEDYFTYFENICKEHIDKKLVINKIKIIIDDMQELLSSINGDEIFETFSLLFGLDSQLQIISMLIDEDDLNDEEILSMAENDYKVYLREQINSFDNIYAPSLHFLIK